MKATFKTRLLTICAVVCLTAWVASPSLNHLVAATEEVASDLDPVETDMHEFMEYINQPTYKRLKAAMQAEPTDNQGWLELKSGSLILAETGNLIMLRGPQEERGEWTEYAKSVRQEASQMYRAAHDKDFTKATDSYHKMLNACNSCHKQFANGEYQLSP